MKRVVAAVLASFMMLTVAACESPDKSTQKDQVEKKAKKQQAYIPKNDVELDNYNSAQEIYDDPTTIIWCSTTWGNPSAPIVTVPIRGKLTSSSTTFFRPEELIDHGNYSWSVVSSRSVDGLFHPNPPQYRYGFTPGGQYVDFFNMDTFCTTQPTKFQRQSTEVVLSIDGGLAAAQEKAQKLLADGREAAAQRVLENAVGG